MSNETLFATIKAEAGRIDAIMAADLEGVGCALLSDVLRHALFQGGKRIRPLLTLLAARIAGDGVISPEKEQSLYELAAVFEYLHAASLLHDDVIDKADTRRGQPSANAIWGSTAVILAGDFLHARAMSLAGKASGQECLAVVSFATMSMIDAEFLQMQAARASDQSEATYFQVLEGKTSSLIGAACESGAIFADATADDRIALRTYGRNLGLAFQIVDDLLDYQGDPAKTGKVNGNDFVEGKMTLPLLHALAKGTTEDRDRLNALLAGSRAERAHAFAEARKIILASSGFTFALARAEHLIATAIEALDGFVDSPAKKLLLHLAGYVLTRDK